MFQLALCRSALKIIHPKTLLLALHLYKTILKLFKTNCETGRSVPWRVDEIPWMEIWAVVGNFGCNICS